MKERQLSSELVKSAAMQGYWYYKIPDAYNMERFSPKKPFDAFLITPERVFFIELKVCNGKSIRIDAVKIHQITGLRKAQGIYDNNCSYIGIYFTYVKEIYFINIEDYMDFIDTIKRKSFTIKDLDQHDYDMRNKEWCIGMKKIKVNKKSYWNWKDFVERV